MKKDRNSQYSSFGDDCSLPRTKILRGRKNFQRLFENDAYRLHNRYIGLRYLIVDKTHSGCLMGFITPKKLGKANKRNRMKRLLKESYRIHQAVLANPIQSVHVTFHGVLIAYALEVSFKEVEQNVISLLEKVAEQIPRHLA